MAESPEFAVDAAVSPCRVLGVQEQYEASKLGRPTCSFGLVGAGPTAGNQSAVPADHGRWPRDHQHLVETSLAEGLGQCGEHGAIGRCETRLVGLAMEQSDLVVNSEDLGVTVIA
ncbi:MAG: hypothetical protein GY925_20510 [Actinomycetia bacterium]|nr:hypothetical protein [Actinomycetes bacterium]